MAKLAKTFLTMIIKVDDLPFLFLHKKQVCLPLPLKK